MPIIKWEKFSLDNELFQGIDALVILTEWEEYSKINWNLVANWMNSPGWVFDSRSIVDTNKILNNGLNLWRVGDGTLKKNNLDKI